MLSARPCSPNGAEERSPSQLGGGGDDGQEGEEGNSVLDTDGV